MSNRNDAQLVSVVMRLERSKLDRLKALSAETRVRQSEYLREAITDVLAKHAPTVEIAMAWERSQLTCGCGRAYTWSEYLALPTPQRGDAQDSFDDDGAPIKIPLRQCSCNNTMARLPAPCPPGWKP